jgi:PAS domain S-box-containing protein
MYSADIADIARFRSGLGPFVTAAESTRMPMIFTDTEPGRHTVLFANESFLSLIGTDSDEVLGQPFGSLMATNHQNTSAIEEHHFSILSHDNLETRFRRKDGIGFLARVFVSPVLDKAGEIAQYFISLVDLTPSKKSEEALRFSKGRLRMAVVAARLGIADIDLVSHEEHWSKELREILGLPHSALPSKQTYAALLHPDDRARVLEVHARSLRGEPTSDDQIKYRIIRPSDGAVRWIASERNALLDEVVGWLVSLLLIETSRPKRTLRMPWHGPRRTMR